MSLRNLYGRAFVPLGRKGNPIRCDGAQGQHFYLDRLRDPNGNGIEYQRVGAAGQGPYGRLLDEYVIQDVGPLGRSLFLDMYHPGHSETKAPEGLFIVNYLSGKHNLKLSKDASFAEIERHAWRIAKAFKDDAKPLSIILRNAFTEEQCHRILVFAGALVVHDYQIKKDKFVDIVLGNKELGLDEAVASTVFNFLVGVYSDDEEADAPATQVAPPVPASAPPAPQTPKAAPAAEPPNKDLILEVGLIKAISQGTSIELKALDALMDDEMLYLIADASEIGEEDDGTRWHFEYDKHGVLERAWYFYGGQTVEKSLNELTKFILPKIQEKLAQSGRGA